MGLPELTTNAPFARLLDYDAGWIAMKIKPLGKIIILLLVVGVVIGGYRMVTGGGLLSKFLPEAQTEAGGYVPLKADLPSVTSAAPAREHWRPQDAQHRRGFRFNPRNPDAGLRLELPDGIDVRKRRTQDNPGLVDGRPQRQSKSGAPGR